MAWHRKSVEVFLANEQVDKAKAEAILARVTEAAGVDEIFSSTILDHVMEDESLARRFERAWERDPSVRRAAFGRE